MVSLSVVKDISYFTEMKHQSGHGMEYFSEQGKSEGWWQGKLAEKEGLNSVVTEQDITRLTQDYERVGLNVTYSAPKSVSLAYSILGDSRIKDIHEQAVRVANSWLEQNLAETRQGQGGAERVGVSGVGIANFTHHTSRENDPQLHTHSVVLNCVERATDGKITALEPQKIYEYQKALDQVYKNELARGLQELGYSIQMTDQHGNFEIVGFSEKVLQAFSTRSQQVQETAERLRSEGKIHTDEYALKDIAALESRAEKQFLSAEELQKKWDQKLREIGLTRDELRQQLTQCLRSVSSVSETVKQSPEREHDRAVEYVKAATAIIHENESAFTQEKLTEIALRLSMSDATKNEKVLGQKDISAAIQGLQQRGWISEVERGYYTTVEMQKKEQEIIHMVREGQGKVNPFASEKEIQSAIERFESAKNIRMTNDQKQAVHHILESRDGVIGIQGDAGTGKTTSLEVVKDFLHSQGYVVRGFAPTGKAADELAKVGIKSQTVDSFLTRNMHVVSREDIQKYHELDKKFNFSGQGVPFLRNETPESWIRNQIQKQLGHQEFGVKQYAFQNGTKMVVEWNQVGMNVFVKHTNGDITVKTFARAGAINSMVEVGKKEYHNPERTIEKGKELWVIDETSMLSSQKMHELLQRAKEADARVVFVGDTKQLASVGAGKMFEELQQRGMSTFRMKENIRQVNAEYRQLVKDLADKKFEQVMEKIQIHEVKNAKDRVDMIVRDFVKDPDHTIVVANRNREVGELNGRIREELVKQGKVEQGEEYTVRVSKNLSAEEKKYSFSYSRGDVVFMQHKDLKEIGISTKQNEFLVKGINHKDNTISVVTPDMKKEYTIDLQKYGEKLSVYQVSRLNIGVGDRLVSGKNDRELGLKNGQMWTVRGIQDGKIFLQNQNGQKTVDLSKYNYFSRGYAITTHKAQGMTVRNIIISAQKETNYQSFYTQITRGKEQYTIYSPDRQEVLKKMQQEQAKTSSLPSRSETRAMEQAHSHGIGR